MRKTLVIIGAGGHAREALDICEALNAVGTPHEVLGYIVEREFGAPGDDVNGKPILGDFDWLRGRTGGLWAVCAVGTPALRARLVRRAHEVGVRFCNLLHPSAAVTPRVRFGEGIIIAAGSVLTTQITVGDHVHVNIGCTVSHDVVLADFATLAPGVHIAGRVHVGEGCNIGIGAAVLPRLRLGAWSVIGAGTTVIRDVPPDSTVVGVPGKVVKTREKGWHLS